jgi:hypothetical protein
MNSGGVGTAKPGRSAFNAARASCTPVISSSALALRHNPLRGCTAASSAWRMKR